MPRMRGLTIVLGEAAPPRLTSALTLLLAQAALGGRARLFLQGPAGRLVAEEATDPLWTEALDAGVEVILCQTGLADAGLTAAGLDQRLGYGGPISLLQELGDDRLVLA